MKQSIAAGMGLCEQCRHHRMVRSERQEVYLLCEYSRLDPRFEKYPRLPVLNCSAHSSTNNTNGHEKRS